MKHVGYLISGFIFISITGCSFGGEGPKSTVAASGWEPGQTVGGANYSPSNLTESISSASRILLNRLPTEAEQAQAAQGVAQYETVIRQYLDNPAFVNVTMKNYFNDIFEMQGTVNIGNNVIVNREEPTNLARFIIQNNGDYRDMLKSTSCYDNNLSPIPCTSFGGNPTEQVARAAGALTTQAFLQSWVGPHNFRRVRKAFMAFTCNDYPDSSDTGMTADEVAGTANGSTANFNTTNPEPGGLVCYSCHNNLNARATLFMNFNQSGVFVPPLAGAFPGNVPLNIVPTEVANRNSRISDLLVAQGGVYPIPRYKGQPVESIRAYALALADSEQFRACTARRFYNFMMGRTANEPLPAQVQYLEQIVPARNYNVKEIIVEVAKSIPFVNR